MSRSDRLWRGAYCSATLAVSGFLSYEGVRRFLQLHSRGLGAQLTSYLALLALHAVCSGLFCVFSFVRSGNLANDGYRFGRRPPGGARAERHVRTLQRLLALPGNRLTLRQHTLGVLLHGWQHALPLCPLLHVASAYCLLLALTMATRVCVSAQLATPDTDRDAQVDSSNVLLQLTQTELDWAFQRSAYLSFETWSGNSTAHGNDTVGESDWLSERGASWPTKRRGAASCLGGVGLPLEFFNYVAALLVLVWRYAAVVFSANRLFALVLGGSLLLQSAVAVLDYQAVSVLYRIGCCTSLRSLLLDAWLTLLLVSLGNSVLLFASVFVFKFAWTLMRQTLCDLIAAARRPRTESSDDVSGWGSGSGDADGWLLLWRDFSTNLHGHVLFAVGVMVKAPYLWDLVVSYRALGDVLFLVATFANALGALSWSTLWLLLTASRDRWRFDVLPASGPTEAFLTRSQTVATVLTALSTSAAHDMDIASVSDGGFRYYVPRRTAGLQPLDCDHTDLGDCVYAEPFGSAQWPARPEDTGPSRQSLTRKSILRSATQGDLPLSSFVSRDYAVPHFHDQYDRVTQVQQPVSAIGKSASSLRRIVEQDANSSNTDNSCNSRGVSALPSASATTPIVPANRRPVAAHGASVESVSSDSGCVPQIVAASGNVENSFAVNTTLSAAPRAPLHVASPTLPSPTSLQSAMTAALNNEPEGASGIDTAELQTSSQAPATVQEDAAGPDRPVSMIVDCPMHGYVYWPSQSAAEQFVCSEV